MVRRGTSGFQLSSASTVFLAGCMPKNCLCHAVTKDSNLEGMFRKNNQMGQRDFAHKEQTDLLDACSIRCRPVTRVWTRGSSVVRSNACSSASHYEILEQGLAHSRSHPK